MLEQRRGCLSAKKRGWMDGWMTRISKICASGHGSHSLPKCLPKHFFVCQTYINAHILLHPLRSKKRSYDVTFPTELYSLDLDALNIKHIKISASLGARWCPQRAQEVFRARVQAEGRQSIGN